ncbi:MAG TPA: hypothetical protein VF908_10740 [Gemmatimonadaceae bacterium]
MNVVTPESASSSETLFGGEKDHAAMYDMICAHSVAQIVRCAALFSILFYFKNLLKTDSHLNSPPGYLPVERLRKRLESGAIQETEVTWEGLTSVYRTVLGTPDQVAERIAFWCEQAQSSKIILHLHVGDMPHWKAVKNITLFA